MANIKPLGQRVLVKRIEAETKTAGVCSCRTPPRKNRRKLK